MADKVKKSKTNETKTKAIHTSSAGFNIGKYNDKLVSTHRLKFAKLYSDTRLWPRYLIAIVIGIIMGVVTQLLINNTGLYSSGLGALTQGLARLVRSILSHNNIDKTIVDNVYNIMFWLLYFICNIPLFIIGYIYIGKTFAKLTLVFLIFNTGTGLILSYCPSVSDIFLLGDTSPTSTSEMPNWLYYNGISILPFSYSDTIYTPAGSTTSYYIYDSHDQVKTLFLVFYAIALGLIQAGCYSVLYIISSCSAGLDFVSFYYSVKKGKSINNILVITNFLAMFIGSLMGSYCAAGILYSGCWQYQWLFSANLVCSILSIIVFKFTLNHLYPSDKLVRIEVYTTKEGLEKILASLKAANYIHGSTVVNAVGTFLGLERKVFQSVCMYSELPRVFECIKKSDPSAFICAFQIMELQGKLKIIQQGSVE